MPLKIDPEFSGLCPELTTEELSLLEASIEADGVREAVYEWNGVVVDGHNRFRIATRFKLDCPSRPIEFADRAAAIEWIVGNQLGRRNLTDEQKSYLRGKRYHSEKTKGPNNPTGRKNVGDQNGHQQTSSKTRKKLANEFGVGSATIERDARFARAVDAIAEAEGPEAKQRILSGQSGLTRDEVCRGKTEADAKPLTLRSALRKQRAKEKSMSNGHASGAISQQSADELFSAKQKKARELFEAIKRIAATVDSIISQKDQWIAAVEGEHWTSHTKTTIRNKLSGVETDFRSIHKFLK